MVGPVRFCFGRDGCPFCARFVFCCLCRSALHPRAPTLFPFSSFHLPSLSPFLSFLPSGLPRPCSSHAMFLLALGFRPFISLPGELFRVNNFCFIFAPATSHPEWCGSWFVPAWFVDSAVRWRRNGARGLRKIVVRLRLFATGFLRFCNSQCRVSRSQLTVLVRQRYRHRLFVRRGRPVAQIFSCRSPRGEFCEPPQGGASARTAEADV